MTAHEMIQYLDPRTFEPFRIILKNNEEFDIYERVNVKVMKDGLFYIFRSVVEEPGVKDLVGIRRTQEIRKVEKLTTLPA